MAENQQPIRLKRNLTPDARPSESDLVPGEVALNVYDGRMYTKTVRNATHKIIELSAGDADDVYYVSTNGRDDFDGRTLSRSFRTIKAACELLGEPYAGNFPEATANIAGSYNDAAALLELNKSFIQAEVRANVSANEPGLLTSGQLDRCETDTGYIVDAIVNDLRDGGYRYSERAALAYYEGTATSLLPADQISPTTNAISLIGEIGVKVIANEAFTPTNQSNVTQVFDGNFSAEAGSLTAVSTLTTGITDTIQGPTLTKAAILRPRFDVDAELRLGGSSNAATLINLNKSFIQAEVIAFVDTYYSGLLTSEQRDLCERDTGFIVDAIVSDLENGGITQSGIAGLSYYENNAAVLPDGQVEPTVNSISYIKTISTDILNNTLVSSPLQGNVSQIVDVSYTAEADSGNAVNDLVDGITTTIQNPKVFQQPRVSANFSVEACNNPGSFNNASNILLQNKAFLREEIITYVDNTYAGLLTEEQKKLCKRDTGLIIDAVAKDLKQGGSAYSEKAALFYFEGANTLLPANQISPTTDAISYLKTYTTEIINNTANTSPLQSNVTQVIDANLTSTSAAITNADYLIDGIDDTITTPRPRRASILVKAGDYTENNPISLPPNTSLVGDGLRSVSVRPKNKTKDIIYVQNGSYITGMTFRDHLSPAAAVAYDPARVGETRPLIVTSPYVQNCSSITTTGTGMRIDGSKVLGNTRSMVVDSYTQFNQGGVGIHILNSGYAQLVSVFTICCADGFLCESGGFCSITNSNSSFGERALKATGNSQVLYNGVVQAEGLLRNVIIGNLSQRPNVGDSVKFEGIDTHYTVANATPLSNNVSNVTLLESLGNAIVSANANVNFHQRSLIVTSGHTFEYVGSGNDIDTCLPSTGAIPVPANKAVEDANFAGRVFYTGTDETGDFFVSGDFIINQNTGTVSGRAFDKSLFAVITPYVLALEG